MGDVSLEARSSTKVRNCFRARSAAAAQEPAQDSLSFIEKLVERIFSAPPTLLVYCQMHSSSSTRSKTSNAASNASRADISSKQRVSPATSSAIAASSSSSARRAADTFYFDGTEPAGRAKAQAVRGVVFEIRASVCARAARVRTARLLVFTLFVLMCVAGV